MTGRIKEKEPGELTQYTAEQQKILRQVTRLIGFPSVKAAGVPGMPFGKDIANCLDDTLKLCESLGFRIKNCNGYAGYAEAGEGEEMLGILMHLDVVPAGSGWTYPPFGGEIHDGRIYGRGAIDDKGPAVAAIYALKSVIDSGSALNKRVRLIFGTDEENDWEDMDYYTKNEELPTYGFTPDADFPLIYAEKGILQLDLYAEQKGEDKGNYIRGGEAANVVPDFCRANIHLKDGGRAEFEENGTSAHASVPEEGDNAISKVFDELYRLKKREELDCSGLINRLIDFYHDKVGFCLYGEKLNCDLADEQTGRLTFNVGAVDAADSRVNLSIDMRCPVSFFRDEILERIEKEIEGYGLSIENVSFLKPVYLDRNDDVIKKLLKIYRDITGDESEPLTTGGGTYAHAMDHIVAFGPLFPGREATAHEKDEYILIEDLFRLIEIYSGAIREYSVE